MQGALNSHKHPEVGSGAGDIFIVCKSSKFCHLYEALIKISPNSRLSNQVYFKKHMPAFNTQVYLYDHQLIFIYLVVKLIFILNSQAHICFEIKIGPNNQPYI